MTAYILVGLATSYWLINSSNGRALVSPLEAVIVIITWPALLASIAMSKK